MGSMCISEIKKKKKKIQRLTMFLVLFHMYLPFGIAVSCS